MSLQIFTVDESKEIIYKSDGAPLSIIFKSFGVSKPVRHIHKYHDSSIPIHQNEIILP